MMQTIVVPARRDSANQAGRAIARRSVRRANNDYGCTRNPAESDGFNMYCQEDDRCHAGFLRQRCWSAAWFRF